MKTDYDLERREFLIKAAKLAGTAALAYFAGSLLTACSPPETRKRADSFKIGNTIFETGGEWSDSETQDLYRLYSKAYPLLKDSVGDEPTSTTGGNVKVMVSKDESSQSAYHNKGEIGMLTPDGSVFQITLPGAKYELSEFFRIHELSHVFNLALWYLPDTFREGVTQAAALVAGHRMGKDYTEEMKRYKGIQRFKLEGFHTHKLSSNGNWQTIMELYDTRLMLGGESWKAVHDTHPDFFEKLNRNARGKSGFDPFALASDSFSGNIAEFRERYPILAPAPEMAQYVAAIPSGSVQLESRIVDGIEILTFQTGDTERIIPDVPLRLTLTKDGRSMTASIKTNFEGVNVQAIEYAAKPPYVMKIEAPFDSEEIEIGPRTYKL